MGNFSFRKEERLKKEKLIKELFDKGSSFTLSPIRVSFLLHPDQSWPFHQVLFSVPARVFKKAVNRNTLKRRMRESWRLNKDFAGLSRKYLLAYIYVGKEIVPFDVINEKMRQSIKRLEQNEEKK